MATVRDMLRKKGGEVHSIGPMASVLEATQEMNRHKVGALIVKSDDRVVGIFTERDVLTRVVADERNPSATSVEDVMTTELACCLMETDLDEVASVMKNRRIRHVPVLDHDGHLHGMISIGDINAWDSDGKETTIHFLSEYIHGRV
jgi:CBS domain-containing protein